MGGYGDFMSAVPRTLLGRLGRGVLIVVTAAVLLAAAWTGFSYNWAYSEGERAGVLQKFSKKGWLCKTYEGEIAQYVVGGVGPQIWYFSVRDDAMAEALFKEVGQNVQLRYTEHRGLPTTCFGDTQHFAISVTPIPPVAR
jgi:hypothetical protein